MQKYYFGWKKKEKKFIYISELFASPSLNYLKDIHIFIKLFKLDILDRHTYIDISRLKKYIHNV